MTRGDVSDLRGLMMHSSSCGFLDLKTFLSTQGSNASAMLNQHERLKPKG